MTGTEAIAAIRASTLHDNDTQVTDAQILVRIEKEYRRLRRLLQSLIPSLYESVTAPTIASAASNTIAKPALFERVRLLEKLASGSSYYPVPLAPALNRNEYSLSFYEQGANLVVMPAVSSVGTYRLTVVSNPAASFVAGTTMDVPDGCEDIVVERCAAWVRQRHDDAYAYHMQEAERMWKEQRPHLLRRYGMHPTPGLVFAR